MLAAGLALLKTIGLKGLAIGAAVLVVVLLLLNMKRSAEKAGRLAERAQTAEKTNEVRKRMEEAGSHRPRSRDELAGSLRDGTF